MTPDEHTILETFVEVGNGHTLYVQDWGNKQAAMPVVSLHGGPGSASRDKYKNTFDPATQRVIFFDQRGCGRSLPFGSIEHNTTADLVDDIETIAKHLHLDRFVITGGSWGSCLALAYALKYLRRVHALVLFGIFTGSQAEIDWIDKGGFRTFFPETWEQYLLRTPKSHHHDPSAYHYQRALDTDPVAAKESAYAYACLEGAVLSLDDRFTPDTYDDYDPTGTRIEMHYLANRCFMPDRHILQNAHKLTMPVWIAQGRYDCVCPPQTAYELSKALPNSHLFMATSGHRSEHEVWNMVRSTLAHLTA